MKALILSSALVLGSLFGMAQRLDSVNYQYGYLYYHEYGRGETIFLFSGGPGGSYMQLEEVAIELGKRYRCILPEQRGTGRSVPSVFDSTTINLESALADIDL